jgi:hypothetical protein
MRSFEYEITSHPSEVLQNLEYFCSSDGECRKEKKSEKKSPEGSCEFMNILEERGRKGWEFVQLFFLEKSINACWKREKQAKHCEQT